MPEARARTYGDRCGIARALDLVGERWALLVVRELLLGPKRFTDLRSALPHLSADILTQRLRELEGDGIVSRRRLPPPAGSKVYELTDRGRALEGVLLELGRWGSSATPRDPDSPLGPDSMAIALMTMFDSERASDEPVRAELLLDEHVFSVEASSRGLSISRKAPESPQATLATDPATLAELAWRGLGLDAAERSGRASVEGDRRAIERFLGWV